MTKKERELTKQNKELKKQLSQSAQSQLLQDNISTDDNINLFKHKFTASHIVLYAVTIAFFIGVFIGVWVVIKIISQYPEYIAPVVIALFSYIGSAFSIFAVVYSSKSKMENRMKSAMQLAQYLNANKITLQSVYLAKLLSEDESTSVSSINPFGGVTQIDTTKYMASNPMVDNQAQYNVNQYQYNTGNVADTEDVINTPATDNMAQG